MHNEHAYSDPPFSIYFNLHNLEYAPNSANQNLINSRKSMNVNWRGKISYTKKIVRYVLRGKGLAVL